MADVSQNFPLDPELQELIRSELTSGRYESASEVIHAALLRLGTAQDKSPATRNTEAAFLDSVSDCFYAVDQDWRFIVFNAAAERYFGKSRADILGRILWEAFPHSIGTEYAQRVRAVMSGRQPARFEVHSSEYPGRFVDMRVDPMAGGGITVAFLDITERRLIEEALRESEANLRAALDAGGLAIFNFDHAAGEIGPSVGLNEMYGYPADHALTIEDIRSRYHPEDLEFIRNCRHREETDSSVCHFDWTFRLLLPRGITRWVQRKGEYIRSDAGQVLCSRGIVIDITERKNAEMALEEETHTLETLNKTGAAVSAELDLGQLVQMVTDAGVELTGADFGAFLYNGLSENGERHPLLTLSGADRSRFENFPVPRSTAIFHPTFAGTGVIRLGDILADPRYGKNEPYHGLPEGHPPVRSYLAVPVTSRTGEVLGGLFFANSEANRFTERHERLIVGIAAQAAVAMDNARLFQIAQREIEGMARAREHQQLLINELNHRVKNTLATVLSLVSQTLRNTNSVEDGLLAIESRLLALSRVHDVLTRENWEAASLHEIVAQAMTPFRAQSEQRIQWMGPTVRLSPRRTLAIAMALQELATNAVKYGALSNETGQVRIEWTLNETEPAIRLRLHWEESGGPPVREPLRRGFGTRLIERSLGSDLGDVTITFAPDGVVCTVDTLLTPDQDPETLRAA